MPPDEYDALFAPKNPRDRVHRIASQAGISPDIADDYYSLTNVESGHNVNVRDSPKGAKGFGQVMPDVKGGSTRTVGGRRYNLRDADQNIEAGLRYFSEGGSDPVARRLYYFGGPRAKQHYDRTGQIPNISDGNMTAAQYVKATGAQSRPKPTPNPYDSLFQDSGQTPPSETKRASPPNPTATSSPVPPRRQSVPLKYSGTGRAFGQPATPEQQAEIRAGVADVGRRKPLVYSGTGRAFPQPAPSAPAMSARTPSVWEQIKEAVEPYVPGLASLDTPFGIKTDPIRGAISGLTLGAAGDPRQVSAEERIVDPEAQAKADTAHTVGSFAPAVVPYMAAEKALSAIPLLAQEGRIANIARTALTFGGVEAGHEAVRAAKTDTQLDPKEIAISTAIGTAMGGLSGVNPSLKRRLVAFVTPQAVADVARGTDPQTAVTNALTNLGFGLVGGKREGSLSRALDRMEAQGRVESDPVIGAKLRGDKPANGRILNERPVEAPRRWQHTDFGEIVESPNQKRVGTGRVRVTDENGIDHVIKRANLTGAGNQRAIPLKRVEGAPAAEPVDPATSVKQAFKLPLIEESEIRGRLSLSKPFEITYESESGREITRTITIEKRLKELSKKQSVLDRLVDCIHA